MIDRQEIRQRWDPVRSETNRLLAAKPGLEKPSGMACAGSPSGSGDSGFRSPNVQDGVIRLGRVALGITAANDAMGHNWR
jgi:hypothetical protein